MNRTRAKRVFFATAALFCAIGAWFYFRGSPAEIAKGKPSIILFSFDTLRADHLSCYGYERKTSPFVDKFAKESVLFENALTQGAKTASAHMSIFTSVLPVVHGVSNIPVKGKCEYRTLPDYFETLPEVLKEQGYITAGFTGGGNVDGSLGFERGFDHYSKDIRWNNLYRDPKSLRHLRDWIKKSKKQRKPLFLFLHHYICHEPYMKGPRNLRLQFMEKKVEGLPVDPQDLGPGKDYFSRKTKFWKNMDLSNPDHRRHVIALYDGGVLYADSVFQMILDVLRKEGLYDDSLIILLSDHGEEFYEHLGKSHGQLFIESIHVPLLIKFPKGKYAGKKIESIVRTMDVMPTILAVAGIAPVSTMDGVSLLPLLSGESGYDPPLISYSDDSSFYRFQKNNLAYIKESEPTGKAWLIDRATDPHERNNLATKVPETFEDIRTAARKSVLKYEKSLPEK